MSLEHVLRLEKVVVRALKKLTSTSDISNNFRAYIEGKRPSMLAYWKMKGVLITTLMPFRPSQEKSLKDAFILTNP